MNSQPSSASSASERYSRNEIYIPKQLQKRIQHSRILLAGAGLGSVIAECLLRTGFEDITAVDGDLVELSNLNRQNYVTTDIGQNKAAAVAHRLRTINPEASILPVEVFLTRENIPEFVEKADFIINAIDFDSDAHIFLDKVATQAKKTVILPLNLGFGAFAAVFTSETPELSVLLQHPGQNYAVAILNHVEPKPAWLREALERYIAAKPVQGYDPQLAIGSNLVAALVSSLLVQLVNGEPIRLFPEWYFLNTRS